MTKFILNRNEGTNEFRDDESGISINLPCDDPRMIELELLESTLNKKPDFVMQECSSDFDWATYRSDSYFSDEIEETIEMTVPMQLVCPYGGQAPYTLAIKIECIC